jgi:hypothetical protein
MSCFHTVRDQLKSGECAEVYKAHLACVQKAGWRESVRSCKDTREKVGECAVRAGLGELKNM